MLFGSGWFGKILAKAEWLAVGGVVQEQTGQARGIECAFSGPNHSFAIAESVPGDPEPGSEVVEGRSLSGIGHGDAVKRIADKDFTRGRGGNDFGSCAGGIQIRPELLDAAKDFFHYLLGFPAQTHCHRELGPYFPFVFREQANDILRRVRIISRRLAVGMHVTHHETRQSVVGQGLRELPASVFQIRVPDVGLVLLDIAAKLKSVRSTRPGELIADFVGVTYELGVREGPQAEVPLGDAECADSARRFGELRNDRAEVVKLRHLTTLAALRTGAHKGRHEVVAERRSRNPGVTCRPIVGFYRGSRKACPEKSLAI